MRTAFFSDIHGNLTALELVLHDMSMQKVDRMICLGDIVDGGNEDQEVLDRIRSLGIDTVQGNHDLHNESRLPSEDQQWLNELPNKIIENDHYYGALNIKQTDIPVIVGAFS